VGNVRKGLSCRESYVRITAPRLPAQLLSPLLVATSGSMRQLVPRSVSRAPAVARKVNAWNRFAERARGLCATPSRHRLSAFGTHHPMSHAAGNNVVIFDLVDSVAAVGEKAGQFAADYARNGLPPHKPIPPRARRQRSPPSPHRVDPGNPHNTLPAGHPPYAPG